MIESEPDVKKWDLITDCLNTHQLDIHFLAPAFRIRSSVNFSKKNLVKQPVLLQN